MTSPRIRWIIARNTVSGYAFHAWQRTGQRVICFLRQFWRYRRSFFRGALYRQFVWSGYNMSPLRSTGPQSAEQEASIRAELCAAAPSVAERTRQMQEVRAQTQCVASSTEIKE